MISQSECRIIKWKMQKERAKSYSFSKFPPHYESEKRGETETSIESDCTKNLSQRKRKAHTCSPIIPIDSLQEVSSSADSADEQEIFLIFSLTQFFVSLSLLPPLLGVKRDTTYHVGVWETFWSLVLIHSFQSFRSSC